MLNDPRARAEECAKRIPKGGTFLEIGVWRGANASRILRLRSDITTILVDPWAPAQGSYATSGSSDSKLTEPQWHEIFKTAKRNLEPYKDRVSMIRMPAHKFLPLRIRKTYDVIFIDGDHSYEGCSSDIALFTAVAAVWIGGHDYGKASFPGVTKAVDEAFPKRTLGADSTWWHEIKAA